MMKDQRMRKMEEYITTKESVSLKELCDVFQVSMNTVRRYINEMVKHSHIQKVYGGVRVLPTASTQSAFFERSQTNEPAKRAIAQKAAELICENDIIFIDSGTTTMHLVEAIPEHMRLTIITNSFHVINAAIERPDITLICLPGVLDRRTLSFNGGDFHYLSSLCIHKAFLACTCVSVRDGATNSFSEEYAIKREVADKAERRILLADSSKFGKSTLMSYCPLSRIDCIVTDRIPDTGFIRAIDAAQHELIVCGEEK